jgi:hypothetical protein
MSITRDLIRIVDDYLTGSGMLPTEFGLRVAGNTALVSRLRKGRGIGSRTVDKISDYISENPVGNSQPTVLRLCALPKEQS